MGGCECISISRGYFKWMTSLGQLWLANRQPSSNHPHQLRTQDKDPIRDTNTLAFIFQFCTSGVYIKIKMPHKQIGRISWNFPGVSNGKIQWSGIHDSIIKRLVLSSICQIINDSFCCPGQWVTCEKLY